MDASHSTTQPAGSIIEELDGIDLGDQRLNERSQSLLAALAADPTASVNGACHSWACHSWACHSWAETKAAYRFLDNERVGAEQILAPHVEATLQRAGTYETVLCVQDTTELDFSDHPATDSGVLNKAQRFGFYDDTQLLFAPDGLCLGVVDVSLFERTPETLGKGRQRKVNPASTKESYRWLEGYQRACELAVTLPRQTVVSLADSEGDLYDTYADYRERKQDGRPRAEFVIRQAKDRRTPEPDAARNAAQSDAGTDRPANFTRAVEVVSNAKVLDTRTVTLKPPHDRQGHARRELGEVTLGLVEASEVDGPNDGTDICWRLFTSLPVDTAARAWRVVDDYKQRWGIEVYFRILKTGCRVEHMQLETTARQRRCLMLDKIIAWRVLWLTLLGRSDPDVSCEVVLTAAEWKSAWLVAQQTPTGQTPTGPTSRGRPRLPSSPPTLSTMLAVIATLGGCNGRSKDPPPGPQTIWTGLRRTTEFALGWETFGPDT